MARALTCEGCGEVVDQTDIYSMDPVLCYDCYEIGQEDHGPEESDLELEAAGEYVGP